jgi:hypothetical protein
MQSLTQRHRGTEKRKNWPFCAPVPLCEIFLLVVLATGPTVAVADERVQGAARSPRQVAEQFKKSPQSIMPADIQKLLKAQDLVDIVEYLATLKKQS